MLEPLTGKVRSHEFVTYDLEWWPGSYELRLCGVYDEQRGYRAYTRLSDFFDKELTNRNCTRRFYAHFGGSSDVIFLIQYILSKRPDLNVTAIFAGSSAVIVRVSQGNRRKWTFIDSGFLIRRPLADIGEWVGYSTEKKRTKKYIYTEDFNVLRDQNEQDCHILFDAITRLQTQVNYHGGELRATLAATALDLFRRSFLRRKIPVTPDINTFARRAYIASRVEVFRRQCDVGDYYDINSSFPMSMTAPQPAMVRARSRRIPEKGECYLAECRVTVPEMYLPSLAMRTGDSRIIFPTGTWSGVFDSADIKLLLSTGGRIDRVISVTTFEEFQDLAGYVHSLYSRKERAVGYEREVWKLLLNALYGKFAERSEKRQIVIRPPCTSCQHSPQCPEESPCIEMIAPDIYSVKIDREIKHAHVPISAHVTALSRALLYSSLSKCKDIYYCDTDSVVCGRNDKLPTGPALGQLKHEYSIAKGTFLAPKLYSFEKQDGKRVTRAKGFSRLNYEGFCALAEGKDVQIERMQRIRESLGADGTITPRDYKSTKRAHLTKTKRCFLPSGNSRPWTVEEVSA